MISRMVTMDENSTQMLDKGDVEVPVEDEELGAGERVQALDPESPFAGDHVAAEGYCTGDGGL